MFKMRDLMNLNITFCLRLGIWHVIPIKFMFYVKLKLIVCLFQITQVEH